MADRDKNQGSQGGMSGSSGSGIVPPFLNVFIDGDDIRVRDGLATAVSPGSTILLLPAVAGGSPPHRAPQA